jgi:hypothetical protein
MDSCSALVLESVSIEVKFDWLPCWILAAAGM